MKCGQAVDDYPKIYRKIHNSFIHDPLISPHIHCQSIVSDPETGERSSVLESLTGTKFSSVQTAKDIFEMGLKVSAYYPCLASRSSQKEPYSWLHYYEVEKRIRNFGSALTRLIPRCIDAENFVGIYGRNSPEWIIAQYACASYSYTVVPLYATFGEEAMEHIFSQTEMTCLVCYSCKEAEHILKLSVPKLKTVIVVSPDSNFGNLKSQSLPTVQIISFGEVLTIGENNPVDKIVPLPSDLFLVCYTSGSTGLPKGVMITHEQFVDAVIAGVETTGQKLCCVNTVHLSYLPLAHILEQLVTGVAIIEGARIGYLTDTKEGLVTDAESLKPTVLIAVPRVLALMYSKYQAALGNSKFKRRLYDQILKKKLSEQKRGKFNHQSLLDTLLFKKFREALGGHICGILSGGAPLLPEVLDFSRAAFGLVYEGYGSTETCGLTSMTLIGDCHVSTAGAIAYNVKIKLADCPELGLVVSENNTGEICVKGKRCTKGYYKDPIKTAELIDSDGWLHTGDIGQWTPEGALKIVDRIKSMFKLAQGEYVAPEKVEMVYQSSRIVCQIYVDGKPHYNYPVAVVIPDFNELRLCLTTSGLNHHNNFTDRQICEDKKIIEFVLNQLNKIAQEKNLAGFEKVKAIYLHDELFTTENGLLTPTMKLSRFKIRKQFSDIVDNLYLENESQSN